MNTIQPTADAPSILIKKRKQTWLWAAVAFFFCWLIATVECRVGILFEGLDYIFTLIFSASGCVVILAITEWFLRKVRARFIGRILIIEVFILPLLVASLISWSQTRQHKKIFFGSVPIGVRVHQGRSILFSSFMHFSASPEVMSEVIKSHGLELQNTNEESENVSRNLGTILRYKQSWRWWQPDKMSNPRIFLKNHENWVEGWWVNGTTNEVYAFISG